MHEKTLWDATNKRKAPALRRPGLAPLQKANAYVRNTIVEVPVKAPTAAGIGIEPEDLEAEADADFQLEGSCQVP